MTIVLFNLKYIMDIKQLTRDYFEAFQNKDLFRLAELLNDDECHLRDWITEKSSKQEVLLLNQGLFKNVDSIKVHIDNIYVQGNTSVSEIEIALNFKEKKDRILVVDILEFTEEGKIESIKAYLGNAVKAKN